MSIKVTRETHETPEYVTEHLTRSFGFNRFGKPKYRVVWGRNRLGWVNGVWDYQYWHLNLDRWMIEAWCPPEKYGTRANWELTTKSEGEYALGPFPSQGDYEHLLTLEGPRGEFLQLTPILARHIPSAIEKALHQWRPRLERQRLYDREAKKDDEYMRWADTMLDDNVTWSYTPHVYMPANLKERIA